MDKIKKLVLPVAGRGERLMPLTLNTPKALIKVAGKELLYYALEETLDTEIEEVVVVICKSQEETIGNYLKKIKDDFKKLKFHLRFQDGPFGSGDAVFKAYDVVYPDPFIVRYPDDLLLSQPSLLKTLSDLFHKYQTPFFSLEKMPHELISNYGVVQLEQKEGGVYRVRGLVEHPKTEEAPSDFTVIGGYLLTAEIIDYLKEEERKMTEKGKDCLFINIGFTKYMDQGGEVCGIEFEGNRFDCGNLDGVKKAEAFFRNKFI